MITEDRNPIIIAIRVLEERINITENNDRKKLTIAENAKNIFIIK